MTEIMRFFAHTRADQPPSAWQDLRAHLEGVAALARDFSSAWDAGAWGWLAGLWHDLGKYQPEFQAYLRGAKSGPEHAIVGALHAKARAVRGDDRALPLAWVIAGHHAGLANPKSSEPGDPRPLLSSLQDKQLEQLLVRARPYVPADLLDAELPALPSRLEAANNSHQSLKRMRRSFELWIRFLFSALVDADSLDTEAFCQPERRTGLCFDDIPTLRQRLTDHLAQLGQNAPSPVNALRAEVLAACERAADEPPGRFSLSVPTGGGKTLSAMAFALRHAEKHGLRRVIVAIPLTSIIEQNAAVYRRALGAHNVIEHHSNLDPQKETEQNKLASENWDAPIIVTTNVQFFESLLGNRRSRCRKLHNIARSVILLDEAQTLSRHLLDPILEVLQELTDHYGCSLVLATATQPALTSPQLPTRLLGVREIAPDPPALAQRLRRFAVRWPAATPPIGWDELADELSAHPKVLAIVHRRQDAHELALRLPAVGRFHLSALLCPQHRTDVLQRVYRALKREGPCRLVATQLVEAGVDIDFPVVYRALAGLDSLTQAGGRCNREGRLAAGQLGQLVLFRAPTQPPPGILQQGLETTEAILKMCENEVDLSDPAVLSRYFEILYNKGDTDRENIQAYRSGSDFAAVARKFQLIDEAGCPVVMPYGDAAARLEDLRRLGPSRERLRAVQPFVVSLRPDQVRQLEELQALELLHDNVRTLAVGFYHLYDREDFGFAVAFASGEIRSDPNPLIV